MLGSARGADEDGFVSDEADDGVQAFGEFIASSSQDTVGCFIVTASAPAKLDAWIDFNQDNDWDDAGEQIFRAKAYRLVAIACRLPSPAAQPPEPATPDSV